MRKRFVAIMIVIGVAALIGAWYRAESKQKATMEMGDFVEISPYDNTEEKEEAKNKIENGIEVSKVISDDVTVDKYLGLSFQGLSDTATNQKIIALLKEYHRRATFFVPGVQAAECRDDVEDMLKNGNTIGSNGLNVTAHMENLSEDELINDFTAANKVIAALTEEEHPLLQCKATKYTDELLKVANACGNEKIIYSTHFVNYQSFTSYEQTCSYLNKLPRGSILTIKMSGVLDEIEVEDQEVNEKPAEDMQPTLDAKQQEFMELPEEDRIVHIVQWILMAMEESNYQTKSIDEFSTDYTGDSTKIFEDDQLMVNSGETDTIVYPYIPLSKNYAGLQIRGIGKEKELSAFLDKLQESEQTATFYITAKEAESYPDRVQMILDAGCTIENGGADDEILTDHTVEEVQKSIESCNQILKEKYNIESTFFMPPAGRYDDHVKEAAKKENMTVVTYNKRPVIREDAELSDILQTFRRTLSKGSLIYIDLDDFQEVEQVANGVIDMIQDKSYETMSMDTLFARMENDDELTAFSIPITLTENQIAELRKKGQSEAATRQMVYTSERAVAFSFSGIGNGSAVDNVLQKMAIMSARGTFFVTYQEMITYPARVQEIIRQGHEIGIEMIATDKTTFASACNEIAAGRNYLQHNFNTTSDVVMSPMTRTKNEKAISEMKKAIRAMDCTLVGSSVSITQSALKGVITAPEYYEALTKSKFNIQMGQIVFTRLDYLDNSDILGDVLLKLKQEKIDPIAYFDEKLNSYMWIYEIKPVSDVLRNTANNGAKLYNLNSGDGSLNTINMMKNDYSDNTLLMDALSKGYIGNPDVTDWKGLVSFSPKEIESLDKTGLMPGDRSDNHVFLSFDDWGTDKSINQLLYVLHKYQLKATFFVRSNNVLSNPNLLREIAMEGHEIGSHTSTHFRLSNEADSGVEGTYVNNALSNEEAMALRKDIVNSYQELYKVIGDVNIDGHPALIPVFRPPTLAVSKVGLLQIFETGYQYSISGDFSTQDYTYKKADGGVDKLTNVLLNGYNYWGGVRKIQSHSIVVMHMSENSECTAEAIENWMEKGARSKYNFATPMYQYLSK